MWSVCGYGMLLNDETSIDVDFSNCYFQEHSKSKDIYNQIHPQACRNFWVYWDIRQVACAIGKSAWSLEWDRKHNETDGMSVLIGIRM